MTKGDKKETKLNRGEALLRKIVHSNDFQREIRTIRRKYSIHMEGFDKKKDVLNWYSKVFIPKKIGASEGRRNSFLKSVDSFLSDQNLPIMDWWCKKAIEQILANGKIDFLPPLYNTDPFVKLINTKVSKHGSYVDIRVYERATQQDVRDFVSKHWKFSKPSYRIGTLKQIRKERSADANDRILELKEYPKETLEDMAKDENLEDASGVPREILISRIIQKELGITIDSNSIGGIIRRRKKGRK